MYEGPKNFILNSRVNRREIIANITRDGKKFPQRAMFVRLRKYAGDFLRGKILEPRMIGIAGIRGVGKTTLLWQIADFVYNNYPGVVTYFVRVDIAKDYGFKNSELIEALKEVISPSQKVVLLFDEVQYLENWSLFLKIIYDLFKGAFIVASGSSSLLIRSSVDLSTRWSVESLYPLSLTEFVKIRSWLRSKGEKTVFPERGLGTEIKKILFFSNSAGEVEEGFSRIESRIENYLFTVKKSVVSRYWRNFLDEYIFYHNIPRLLLIDEKNTIISRAFDLLHRLLSQDLREFYGENDIERISRFLILLAFSDDLSSEKMSKSLGIKVEKLERIIDSLVKSELLLKFPAYGGVKTRIKKDKLFFVSPTMRYAIIKQIFSETEQFHSKFYEDIIALYLKRIFNGLVLYGGMDEKRSPDFVIDFEDRVIPVEVGTNKQDFSQLTNVRKKKYGIMVNVGAERVRGEGENVIVPLKWFLLM